MWILFMEFSNLSIELGQRYKLWALVGGALCAEGVLDFATNFNISDI